MRHDYFRLLIYPLWVGCPYSAVSAGYSSARELYAYGDMICNDPIFKYYFAQSADKKNNKPQHKHMKRIFTALSIFCVFNGGSPGRLCNSF